MKYLSICSGIEAATVAWEPLGWEAVGFAEIEPFRSAVLNYHYPKVKNYEDFTKIEKSDLQGTSPDLIVGGTPCATFSIAGLRKGLGEDRGNLALEFIRLIDRLKPTWVVWENVPGVLSSNGGKDLGTFLGALAECRYGFAYRILNTEYVRTQRFPRAIPQRRRRLFVVGHLGDWKSPAKVLFDSSSMRENVTPCRRKRESDARESETDSGGSDTEYWRKLDRQGTYVDESSDQQVSSTLTARGRFSIPESAIVVKDPVVMRDSQTGSNGKPWNDENVSWSLTAHDRYTVIETSTPDKTARVYKDEVSPTLTAMTGGNKDEGDEKIIVVDEERKQLILKEATTKGYTIIEDGDCFDITQPNSKTRRGRKMKYVCHTLTGGTPNFMKYDASDTRNNIIRRLTPIECERLQGFPDNYTQIPWNGKPKEECPVSKRYEACGRSMSINVMEWLGTRIQKVANGEI